MREDFGRYMESVLEIFDELRREKVSYDDKGMYKINFYSIRTGELRMINTYSVDDRIISCCVYSAGYLKRMSIMDPEHNEKLRRQLLQPTAKALEVGACNCLVV